ncbi:MAG: ABC transporter ATP-binding protein [Gemmatimonadota bacterium]
MSTLRVSVSHLSRKYARDLRRSLWYGLRDIAGEFLPSRAAAGLRPGEFWALDDVSFDLGPGESLAIVGRNGAGKSTLLRILYGLIKPDRGEVRLRGRVAALIELGAGFHPLLTGRENVQLGTALLGLAPREAGALHETVIDFAGLGDFIELPVQSYSAGMRARLGFALAANLEPDVLLVDEVLAVGDFAFQRKCATHMRGYLARGGSLLLVSHNTHQIQSVCTRGVLLDHGQLIFAGSAVETVNRMFAQPAPEDSTTRVRASASGPLTIEEMRAEPVNGDSIQTGDPVRIVVRFRTEDPVEIVWGFSLWTGDQWVCVAGEFSTSPQTLAPGAGELTCLIPRVPLVGGRYALRGAILDFATQQPLALYGWQDAAAALDVRAIPCAGANLQMALNQLVTVDVDWS